MAIMFIIKQKKLSINLKIRGRGTLDEPPIKSPEQKFRNYKIIIKKCVFPLNTQTGAAA